MRWPTSCCTPSCPSGRSSRGSSSGRARACPPPSVGWSLVYPLGWIAYTFLRGAVVDWYPYPFLDVSEIGLQSALVRTGIVAVIFLALAFAVLALERVLPPAPRPVRD